MRYYLDTEFNGFGGQLLSLALVREDEKSLYLVFPVEQPIVPWVADNVMPILADVPLGIIPHECPSPFVAAKRIEAFLALDRRPTIVTDWPDDIRYFCHAIITGPGQMIAVSGLSFEMRRVDAYPSELPGAIQHNAWWDAMALRHMVEGVGA